MSMGRNKDEAWETLPNQWQYVHVRVLQDIRDELKRLNSLLHCSNFISIPQQIRQIRLNTNRKRSSRAKVHKA